MILRRLTKHVKDQNWFAVGVDFLIVVIGVFIGLQVNNWNEARRDREVEASYLARLQQELSEMSSQAVAQFDSVRRIHQLMVEVEDYFTTGQGRDSLNGAHCASLARSHIFGDVIFYPPTIKELIATGRIVLIRDHALRIAILSFDGANTAFTQLRADIQIDRLPLARKYPELLQLDRSSWEDSTCEFERMAEHQAFLNDFIDNRHRYSAYDSNLVERQSQLIKSLGKKVASVRGTSFTSGPASPDHERIQTAGEQMP